MENLKVNDYVLFNNILVAKIGKNIDLNGSGLYHFAIRETEPVRCVHSGDFDPTNRRAYTATLFWAGTMGNLRFWALEVPEDKLEAVLIGNKLFKDSKCDRGDDGDMFRAYDAVIKDIEKHYGYGPGPEIDRLRHTREMYQWRMENKNG